MTQAKKKGAMCALCTDCFSIWDCAYENIMRARVRIIRRIDLVAVKCSLNNNCLMEDEVLCERLLRMRVRDATRTHTRPLYHQAGTPKKIGNKNKKKHARFMGVP